MAELFWFSDAQWARIAPLLPTNTRGMKRVDDRRVLSGIVHVLKSTGPELGFLTGGFHLDLPASIANIARLSGVDIKIDENGDWTYQGRKIDDIAAEQGKTKSQVLTEIFQTEVIPALPPGAGAPRSSGVLPPVITAGGGKFTGTVNVDVRSQVTDEQREAFKDTISNMTDNAFSDQELDIIIDSMLKDLGFFEAGWNGFLSIDPYANPLQLTDGQGRIIHRLISRIPGELSSRVQHQLRIAIESGRVVCATCLGPNT